jgi:hypothetical protein
MPVTTAALHCAAQLASCTTVLHVAKRRWQQKHVHAQLDTYETLASVASQAQFGLAWHIGCVLSPARARPQSECSRINQAHECLHKASIPLPWTPIEHLACSVGYCQMRATHCHYAFNTQPDACQQGAVRGCCCSSVQTTCSDVCVMHGDQPGQVTAWLLKSLQVAHR